MTKRRLSFRAEFGQRLRNARIERGLSQREVAETAGIADKYLSRVEVGAATPSVAVAFRLAKAIGVSLDALTGHHEDPLDPRVRSVIRALRRLRPEDLDRAIRVLAALTR